MKKGLILILFLGLLLTACGEDVTSTPPPPFATRTPTGKTTVASNITQNAAQATVAVSRPNPIIATITAGSSDQIPSAPATPTLPPAPTATPLPLDVPIYSGAQPIDLGGYGTQIVSGINQNSRNVRSGIYRTSDVFDKVAGFYDGEFAKLGYTKTSQQPLPERAGLNGNVLIYTKGAGTDGSAVAIMALGPLEESLAQTLSQASTDAAKLKTGDTLLIIMSGLNKTLVTDLENSVREAPTAKP